MVAWSRYTGAETTGPNTINREDIIRRIVVQCNTAVRDLTGVVDDIRRRVTDEVVPTLSAGYYIQYGGEFENQREAQTRLVVLSLFSMFGVFSLLVKCLGSWCGAVQVIINVPLAAIVTVHTPASNEGAGWWAKWACTAAVRYSKLFRDC